MPIVAAGVHDPGLCRNIGVVTLFLDGQSVHIEAQQDGRAGVCALQQGDDACLSYAGLHFQPQAGQRLGDDAGRARLLEAEFRMAVQVAPDAHQFVIKISCFLIEIDGIHRAYVLPNKNIY